jgi:hypothetical protein
MNAEDRQLRRLEFALEAWWWGERYFARLGLASIGVGVMLSGFWTGYFRLPLPQRAGSLAMCILGFALLAMQLIAKRRAEHLEMILYRRLRD